MNLKHSFAIIVFVAVVGGNITVEGVIGDVMVRGCAALTCFMAQASVLSPCQCTTSTKSALDARKGISICDSSVLLHGGKEHSQDLALAAWRETALAPSRAVSLACSRSQRLPPFSWRAPSHLS